jgi:hypothetical protein
MFLEALIEGSPKTYDTPPFYGNQNILVTTKRVTEKISVVSRLVKILQLLQRAD